MGPNGGKELGTFGWVGPNYLNPGGKFPNVFLPRARVPKGITFPQGLGRGGLKLGHFWALLKWGLIFL